MVALIRNVRLSLDDDVVTNLSSADERGFDLKYFFEGISLKLFHGSFVKLKY